MVPSCSPSAGLVGTTQGGLNHVESGICVVARMRANWAAPGLQGAAAQCLLDQSATARRRRTQLTPIASDAVRTTRLRPRGVQEGEDVQAKSSVPAEDGP